MDTNKINFEYTRQKSTKLKASLTVEASIIYPIFIFVVVSLFFILKVTNQHMNIQYGLNQSISKAAVRTNLDEKFGKATIFMSGIANFSDTKGELYEKKSREYDYSYNYRSFVNILPNPFINKTFFLKNSATSKIWNGDKNLQDENNEYVYITKTGKVYHNNINCTYLKRSTKAVDIQEINKLRNESGSKYYQCKVCQKAIRKTGIVYITNYGTSYHRLSNCRELIRDIKRVLITEVGGRSKCSKCYQ